MHREQIWGGVVVVVFVWFPCVVGKVVFLAQRLFFLCVGCRRVGEFLGLWWQVICSSKELLQAGPRGGRGAGAKYDLINYS